MLLTKARAAGHMLVHSGPRALLDEVRVRSLRALRGRSVGDHFTQFAVYRHADGQSIPLYVGYRDYLKPLHVLAHARPEGMGRYLTDNTDLHLSSTGLGGAVGFLRLLRECGIDPTGARVLDVGCGDGALAFLLASHGATVKGIELEEHPQEWSEDYLASVVAAVVRSSAAGPANAEQIRSRVELTAADIQRSDFGDSFDLIVSNSVLEHVTDLRTGLARMVSMLARGGTMLHLFNPFFSENGGHEWCILDFPWGHVRLTRSEFEEYLTAYRGWEVERAMASYDGSFNSPRITLDEIDSAAAALGLRRLASRERRSCWWETDTDPEVILRQCRRTYPAVTWRDLTSESVLRVWSAA